MSQKLKKIHEQKMRDADIRDTQTRAQIQVGKIIDRLTAYVNGEVELTAAQVSAAKTLLNKVLPDLSTHKHSGDEDEPMRVVEKIERVIVRPE